MSTPSEDPGARPNRVLVALVAPFYVAWVAARAVVSALAHGLEVVWSAVGGLVRAILRPIGSLLRVMGRAVSAVVRTVAAVLEPIQRAISRLLGAVWAGLRDAAGELRESLVAIGRAVAPALRAVGRGLGELIRAFVVGLLTIGHWTWRFVGPMVRLVDRGVHVVMSAAGTVGRGLRTFVGALGSAVAAVGRAVAAMIGRTVSAFRRVVASVVGGLRTALRPVATRVAAVARAIGRAAAAAAVVIARAVRTIASRLAIVAAAFSVAGRFLRAQGRRLDAAASAAIRPVQQGLRAATDEIRLALVAAGFERARPDPRRETSQAQPMRQRAAPGDQAHPAHVRGSEPIGGGKRPSASASIAVTSGALVLIVGGLYEILHLGSPVMSTLSILGACLAAGLITAPEHAAEGWIGFGLGMVLAVAGGAFVTSLTGGSISNPIAAVIALWIVGPIGFIPGWVIGGRRHHRRAQARPVDSVPGRPVPR